jgi:aminotransferase
MLAILERSGFRCLKPRGAYYIMADISHLGFENDIALARHMVEKIGVAAVPGSSFFSDPSDGSRFIRFCFAKKRETLEEAGARLAKL